MDKVEQPLADKLAKFAEAYGTAVRAGVITPNLEDEKAVRKMFGLPEPSGEVIAEWKRTKGVRLPITLAKDLASSDQQSSSSTSTSEPPPDAQSE